ncbi:MAG: LemA family protein [Nanoarchaeota archaeon]|nr:LemA family protein [Nanoarchaeota archaeon]MCG2719005.1 LemA family protein [Nanoarchaeota archaeon]
MKGLIKLGIIAAFVFIVGGLIYSTYIGLVDTQEDSREKWSQVENVYQRRADLLPNYVKVVKSYAAHEKELFTAVADARAKLGSVNISADQLTDENLQKFEKAQSQISNVFSRLLMIKESYPELKANENFLKLQDELAGTENRIAVERKRYNTTATVYNKKLRRPMAGLVKGFGDFDRMPLFKADAGSNKAPDLDL